MQRSLALGTLVLLACALVAGVAWSFAGTGPSDGGPLWLVISTNRDGIDKGLGVEPRAYSMRPDGSRLSDLLGKRIALDPIEVSADGRAIVYGRGEFPNEIYVSRADGSNLKRVAHFGDERTFGSAALSPDGAKLALSSYDQNGHPRLLVVAADGSHRRDLGPGAAPDWSPDGKKLVFATPRGCAVVAEPFTGARGHVRGLCGVPRWSPDGKSFVSETNGGCEVVASPLVIGLQDLVSRTTESDRSVFLRGRCDSPEWSPDGRWIAFVPGNGLSVVRPNGEDPRRLVRAGELEGVPYSWSPDSTRLALADSRGILVAGVGGAARRLRLGVVPTSASYKPAPPVWSPDGERLLLVARAGEDPAQIWSVRPDGSGLRRLTSGGDNELVGLARQAPARPQAPAVPPSERVLGPATLATGAPIGLVSADGQNVAYAAAPTRVDCEHVSIWAPRKRSILRAWPRLPAPCDAYEGYDNIFELALAGSFLGWSQVEGCGNTGCEASLTTTRIPEADPFVAGDDDGADYGMSGHRYFEPTGHGRVFASDLGLRVALPNGRARRCPLPGEGYAESVDAGHAAVEVHGGIAVLDDRCSRVSTIPLDEDELKKALLDGRRLVVSRSGAVEAYDFASGALVAQRPLPGGYVLADAAGGVALLRHRTTILLLRLGDGRAVRFTACRGPVLAQIERAGLYYTYTTFDRGGRLVFVPWQELERRLASGRNVRPRCPRSTDNYSTGPDPTAIAIRDLNHDGKPDLVNADGSDAGSVSVLLRGAGTFRARRDYRTHGSPYALAIGNFDGDGRPDIATATLAPNGVSVLLNRGDGTFAPAHRRKLGDDSDTVAFGDLDGDGAEDLVAGHIGSTSVSVLLNRGDGTFGPHVDLRVGREGSSLLIGDATGDGKPDLVVGSADAGILVLPGKGDGTFGPRRSYRGGGDATPVAIADLSGDGRPDVLLIGACRVSALLGHEGGLGARTQIGRARDCVDHAAIGDVNGDGRPDVVTAGQAGSFPTTASVFLNRGQGLFVAARYYETGAPAPDTGGIAIGDLNGDGRPDLAAGHFGSNSVGVLGNTLGVCRVRHFHGQTLVGAKRALKRAGCRIGALSHAYSKAVARGHVIAAEPRFGAYWPDGPEVDLVLSRGRGH